MKLIGSKVENNFRKELVRGNEAIFKYGTKNTLLKSMKDAFPEMISAYILDWIPEQGEDIYVVLIDENAVAVFELSKSRTDFVELKNIQKIDEYRRSLKKIGMIKLLVALDLASKHTA